MMVTTLGAAPIRISESELAEARRIGSETSPVYRRLLEQHENYKAWEQRRDAEETRLRQEREDRLAKSQRQQADEREAARVAADDQLREDLRRRFAVANPTATDADFERLLPRLRDEELIARTRAGRNADVEAAMVRAGGRM